jgi:hypothetical protein
VDYLNLDRAQDLLRRRVIGVPVAFSDFCYCMAGGLPRDLIRAFRGLFEEHIRSNSGGSDLSALCGSLVRADLQSKLHAVSVAAKGDMSEQEVDRLFASISKLESLLEPIDCLPGSCPALLELCTKFLDEAGQGQDGGASPDEAATKREITASLSTELGVYLYYCVTLLEFFGREDLDEETLRAAENSGALDRLARARQFFAFRTSRAKAAITDFRERQGMAIPESVALSSGTPE